MQWKKQKNQRTYEAAETDRRQGTDRQLATETDKQVHRLLKPMRMRVLTSMVRASSSSPSFCAARTANPRLAEIGNEAAFEDDDEEPEDDEEFKEHRVLLDSRAFRNL